MSKDWFTATELAGLPGVPETRSAVIRRAKRDEWESRRRAGRGGGREYAFTSLPVETQAAILERTQPAEQPKVTRPSGARQGGPVDRDSLWDAFDRKPQSIKDEAARRLSAVQSVERLVESGTGRSRAVVEVARVYGESRATLYRWLKAVKGAESQDWLALLAPRYQGRTAHAECDPAAWEFFKAQYLRPEAPSIAACYEWTKQAAAEHGWTIPSERSFNRWVGEIPRTVRVLKREGELAMLRLYPSQKRTVADLHAMYWLNGDGYQHNVFVRFPDGTVARPKTWFWQDVYSRRIVGYRTDRTEHSDVIRLALGDVIERYGIPEHATIDNTRAAANKWMTGGVANRYRFKVRDEDPLGLMPQLGIDVHWTSVHKGKGHGQAKPVERTFGVGGLGEYVDKRWEFRTAYTGPNVTAKPENYGEGAVEWDTFVQVLDQAIATWNTKDKRRTEICAGELSFDAAFRDSYERNAHRIRTATEAQRRMWLLAAESVRVQRDGAVALDVGGGPQGKNRYGCDALIEYAGSKVVVRFDPDHLHDSVHLYQLDGRYIGAAECIHAAGFGDTTAGREWSRLKKERVRSAKKAATSELQMREVEVSDLIPEPDTDPEEPAPQTSVVRGSFAERKRAVGSDVGPDDPEEERSVAAGDTQSRFDDRVLEMSKTWIRNHPDKPTRGDD
ncbi:Mu transposase C-terminal domain-containing protein [Arhodomonas aquaeolei]|uniref:transposase domain-containing protein n=1 Tax=Arhodomonas aquaeolei TaxID=2369 RepID=UPI0021687567|nr:transposase domain-containing protein [Arhodomonas aquaeolei]MCS4503860.1 Mu transposase C-terminal domain-containing protein [Arhodomonas aquaeolei]